jgi:hypothetical protein
MIISEKYKFIYIAVPKTASRSIENVLSPYGKTDFPVPEGMDQVHIKALDLRNLLQNKSWDDYFKFAFVRNPLGWASSWYFFRKKESLADPSHPKHSHYTGNLSFWEFIQSDDWIFDWKQCDWVTDDKGKIIVDYIGKYENLYSDMKKICKKIGIPKQRLPMINISKKREPCGIYSEDSMRLVAERFKEDMEKFGYTINHKPQRPKGEWIQECRNALRPVRSFLRSLGDF